MDIAVKSFVATNTEVPKDFKRKREPWRWEESWTSSSEWTQWTESYNKKKYDKTTWEVDLKSKPKYIKDNIDMST